ncbi:MAG: MFS transporter [Acidobacteria bacterium]|nr:MFS transporter [Acidobacteriota bacterium]
MPKIKGLRWWMIGLIMLGSIINYLTRSSLSVAAPTLKTQLGIDEQHYSWIVSTFQGAIMLQPLCGYVLDVIGLKAGYALFAVAWSIISMLHAFAGNWQVLAGLRGLLGLAEGSANPAGMKATSEWFPAKERGLAGGVYNIGASFGSMLAPPLVGWAILTYNWQAAFVITGALGLFWVVLWWFFYESPEKHKSLSAEEAEYISAGQEKHLASDGTRPSVLSLLGRRNFWGIALPRFLADPTWGTLTYWLPFYFATARGWDLKQIMLFTWLPMLAADIGCIYGGAFSMWLQKKWNIRLINARRYAFTFGAITMLVVGFTGIAASPYLALALLCVAGFAHQTLSVTVITMSSDLFKKNEVATVAGMAGTFGNAGLLIFNLLIGTLVATIGYAPFFVCLGLLDIVGAIILWTVVREDEVAARA